MRGTDQRYAASNGGFRRRYSANGDSYSSRCPAGRANLRRSTKSAAFVLRPTTTGCLIQDTRTLSVLCLHPRCSLIREQCAFISGAVRSGRSPATWARVKDVRRRTHANTLLAPRRTVSFQECFEMRQILPIGGAHRRPHEGLCQS